MVFSLEIINVEKITNAACEILFICDEQACLKKPTIGDARPNISLRNISEKLHEFLKIF